MLETLRTWSHSWPAKLVFGALILSLMSFLGLSNFMKRGGRSTTVAKVGDQKVLLGDLQDLVSQYASTISQRLGKTLTQQQLHTSGIVGKALSELILQAALDGEVARLGLTISDAQVQASLLEDPAFKGENGKFDNARFEDFLRRQKITEKAFLVKHRALLARKQLLETLGFLVDVPYMTTQLVAAAALQKRSARVMRMLPTDVRVPLPRIAELETFYEKNTKLFEIPERRTFSFAILRQEGDRDSAQMYEQIQSLDDDFAAGKTLEEVASDMKLVITTVREMRVQDLTASSQDGRLKPLVQALGGAEKAGKFFAELKQKVFAGDAKSGVILKEPTLLRAAPGVYVALRLDDVLPPFVPTFKECEVQVRRARLVEETRRLLIQKAAAIRSMVAARAIPAPLSGRFEETPSVRLNEPSAPWPRSIHEALFSMRTGEVRVVQTSDGVFVVADVKIVPGDASAIEKHRRALEKPLRDSVLEDFAQAFVYALKATNHVEIEHGALKGGNLR